MPKLRTVCIAGITLEQTFWDALDGIAARERLPLDALLVAARAHCHDKVAAALRVFAVGYFEGAATGTPGPFTAALLASARDGKAAP